MKTKLLIGTAIAAAAAVGLVRFGRMRVAAEYMPLGAEDARQLAADLSTTQAMLAGLRALTGQRASGYQASVTVTP
jgi:hypothetical protein